MTDTNKAASNIDVAALEFRAFEAKRSIKCYLDYMIEGAIKLLHSTR